MSTDTRAVRDILTGAAASAVAVARSASLDLDIDAGEIRVRAHRAAPTAPTDDRTHLVEIEAGAVAFMIRLALRAAGSSAAVQFAPASGDPDVIATIRTGWPVRRPLPEDRFRAPRPDRLPHPRVDMDTAMRLLEAEAVYEHTALTWLTPAQAAAAGDLLDAAAWDLDIPPLDWAEPVRDGTSRLAALSTVTDTRRERVRAGYALQRLVLAAEELGLRVRVFPEIWACATTAPFARTLLPRSRAHAQMLLLVGAG